MSGGERQPLRIDAARNIRHILSVGRAVLRKNPKASVAEIAKGADVGIATIYRRFPTRDDLVRGVFIEIFETELAPAMAIAEKEENPRQGMIIAFEACLKVSVVEGVPYGRGMTMELADMFLGPVSRMIRRGQEEGLFRADLDPEADALRVLLMLVSVLPSMARGTDGWRRYLMLMMDALSMTPTGPLPPAVPITDPWG